MDMPVVCWLNSALELLVLVYGALVQRRLLSSSEVPMDCRVKWVCLVLFLFKTEKLLITFINSMWNFITISFK